MKLGEHIKLKRKSLGYTRKKLSEITGISKSYIGYLECSQRKPSQKMLELLAQALEEDIEKLKDLLNQDNIINYKPSNSDKKATLEAILESRKAELNFVENDFNKGVIHGLELAIKIINNKL